MNEKTRFRITPLLVLTVFALTSFIYHDFNIRMIAGYGLLLFLAVVFIILRRGRFLFNRTKILVLALAFAAGILVLFPHSRQEASTFGVIFSIVTTMLFVLIIDPYHADVKRCRRVSFRLYQTLQAHFVC